VQWRTITYEEIKVLSILMKLSLEGGLGVIDIYGYYLLVVEWLRGIRMQRNIDVFDSFQRMKEIKLSFTKIHIRHIY